MQKTLKNMCFSIYHVKKHVNSFVFLYIMSKSKYIYIYIFFFFICFSISNCLRPSRHRAQQKTELMRVCAPPSRKKPLKTPIVHAYIHASPLLRPTPNKHFNFSIFFASWTPFSFSKMYSRQFMRATDIEPRVYAPVPPFCGRHRISVSTFQFHPPTLTELMRVCAPPSRKKPLKTPIVHAYIHASPPFAADTE